MPRSGPGPGTGLPHISSTPSVAVSKPPTMRSSVDLPQPEGPIRQMNSPFSIRSEASDSAVMASVPKAKRLVTCLTSRMGSMVPARAGSAAERSSMLRAPAQQPAPKHLHQLVGDKAEQTDRHHAGDDDLGAGELPRLHDDGAEPGLHAGHLAHHDHHPGKTQAQPKPGEDRGQRGRQDHLPEDRLAIHAEHRRGLEQPALDAADTEDGVQQDRVEGAEE